MTSGFASEYVEGEVVVMLRAVSNAGLALLAWCVFALVPREVLAVDGFFLSPGSQDTPEADARPGEYYFMLGARAFQKKDYEFAIQMYQVAASWAYKPAEYNLGVMYARGQGVSADLPRAMAWMALAAERNDKHYVDAREAVYAEMTKEQFDQANVIWRELKKTYGDDVALSRAKSRWAEVRSQVTGSHAGSVGNLEVSSPGDGVSNASSPGRPAYLVPSAERKTAVSRVVGVTMNNSGPLTPGEVNGGQGVDGSIAYRHLQQSDNPYDPKFRDSAIGIATVGQPTPVDASPSNEATGDKADAKQRDN
jgi:hypothetical protein